MVIAIIAILAALLLPVLSRAKLKAQQVHCINNLRQLTLACSLYVGDHEKQTGYRSPNFPGGEWMGTLIDYVKNERLRLCASAPLRTPTPPSGNRQGSADAAWVRWTSDRKTMFYGHGGQSPSSAPRRVPAGAVMSGAIEIGMADGHAELVRLENLWKLTWHLDWQTPAKRPD